MFNTTHDVLNFMTERLLGSILQLQVLAEEMGDITKWQESEYKISIITSTSQVNTIASLLRKHGLVHTPRIILSRYPEGMKLYKKVDDMVNLEGEKIGDSPLNTKFKEIRDSVMNLKKLVE